MPGSEPGPLPPGAADTDSPAGLPALQSASDSITLMVSGANASSYVYSLSCNDVAVATRLAAEIGAPIVHTGLPEGTCTLTVATRNAAEEEDATPFEYSWLIDTTGPAVTLSGGPADGATLAVDNFSYTVSSDASDAASFGYTLTGQSAQSGLSLSTPIAPTGLSDGTYVLEVTATDALGNMGPASTRTFTIDAVAPVVRCTAHRAALLADEPIEVLFDQPVLSAEVSGALDGEGSLVDGNTRLTVTPTPGPNWPDLTNGLTLDVSATAVSGTSVAHCLFDIYAADTQRLYVDGGSTHPTEDGSQQAPFRTLAAAMAAAESSPVDDVIYVREGTYMVAAASQSLQLIDRVSLYGGYSATDWELRPGDNTVLTGASSASVSVPDGNPERTVSCADVSTRSVVDGFELRGPEAADTIATRVSLLVSSGCAATFRYNLFSPPTLAGTWEGVYAPPAAAIAPTALVTHNRFIDGPLNQHFAAHLRGASRVSLTHNTTEFTRGGARTAVYLDGIAAGMDAAISNNLFQFSGGSSSSIGVQVTMGSGDYLVEENTIRFENVGASSVGVNGGGVLAVSRLDFESVGSAAAVAELAALRDSRIHMTATGPGQTCSPAWSMRGVFDDNLIDAECSNGEAMSFSGLTTSIQGNSVSVNFDAFSIENPVDDTSTLVFADNRITSGRSALELSQQDTTGSSSIVIRDNEVSAELSGLYLDLGDSGRGCDGGFVLSGNKIASREDWAVVAAIGGCYSVENNLVYGACGGVGLYSSYSSGEANLSVVANNTILLYPTASCAGADYTFALQWDAAITADNNNLVGNGATDSVGVGPVLFAQVQAAALRNNNIFGFNFPAPNISTGGPPVLPGAIFAANFIVQPSFVSAFGADLDPLTWADNDLRLNVDAGNCNVRFGGNGNGPSVDITGITRTAVAPSCSVSNGGNGISVGAYEID